MFARAILASGLAAGLVGLSGCGPAKLDVTKTLPLEPGDTRSVDLDPQPKPQTITVEFESTAGEVDVGLFKEADAKDLNSIDFGKALKAEKKQAKGSFSVEVPEKTGSRVVVDGGSKKTEVKLHITNK